MKSSECIRTPRLAALCDSCGVSPGVVHSPTKHRGFFCSDHCPACDGEAQQAAGLAKDAGGPPLLSEQPATRRRLKKSAAVVLPQDAGVTATRGEMPPFVRVKGTEGHPAFDESPELAKLRKRAAQ